jgi:hypothetical protein
MPLVILHNKKMDKIIFKLNEIIYKATVIFHLIDKFKIRKLLIVLFNKIKEIIQMDQQQLIVLQLVPHIISKINL